MALHLLPVTIPALDDADHLRVAFSKVANPDNWKYAIKAVVQSDDLVDVIRAITFIAGSKSTVRPLDDGRFEVTAPGYYADVGA
jgi:hypothetical protein